MDFPKEKFNKLLDSSKNILLVGSKNPSLDALSTAMAWSVFLSQRKKKVDLVFAGQIPKYNFFPEGIKINDSIDNINKFKIILDISQTQLKQLSYDVKDNELLIDIVPANGNFKSEDVKTEVGDYKYDLIIVFGAEDLDLLGEVFSEHRHFFQHTTIINIDNSVLNENFGQLNIVESNVSSLAEISYHFLVDSLNEQIATCLLAAMISASNSFQSPKVNPDTLELASELIIHGAKREKIIEALYRTKDIDTLKSWGKVLSRLRKKDSIISSYLENDELENLPQDFETMVRELVLATPGAQVAVIFYQVELYQTEAWIYTIANINAMDLIKGLEGSGHRYLAKISLAKDIDEAREEVMEQLKARLRLINSL
ncbi:MAG: hypothetical protein Q8O32_01485 [bacterium]|nr:hypothetical protein [bacterium]